MAYTPPSWNAVDFGASGEGYTPPAWGEVKFPNEPGFKIQTGSVPGFIGATPIAPTDLLATVSTTILLEVIAAGWVPGDAWSNPWSATGTTVAWKSRAETPRDFSCPTASSVSWNTSFQNVSELASQMTTSTARRTLVRVFPHNVLKRGSIDLGLKSAVAWKSNFAAPA